MAEYTPIDWPFPSAGLNTELHASHIPANALSACTNMYYPQPGLLRARGGIDATYNGSGADDVEVMYYWDYDSKLYHADNNAHLYKNGSAISGVSKKVTSVCSFGVSATPTLIVAENETSGVSLHTYNGSSYAALSGTDVPCARLVMSRYGRLWGTKSAEYPSRVWCSMPGDHTVWTAAYDQAAWWDVAPGHDGVIVDWVDYNGILYIFKTHGIYRMTGDTPASVRIEKLVAADKVVAATVADCGEGVLYATSYGVFPLGIPAPGEQYDLTRNVEASIQAVLASSRAAYSPELGGYVMVNGTTTVWVSNLGNRPDVWTNFTAPAAMSSVYQGNGLWFGGTDGKVYLYDHDDFEDGASTVYTVSFKTGHWNCGDELKRKNIRFVEGALNGGENATATVNLYADQAGTAKQATALTAATQNLVEANFNCKTVALEIVYTSRTGLPYFGGARLKLRPVGDVL